MFVYSLKAKRLLYVNDSLASIFDISHEAFKHQPPFFVNHVIREDLPYLEGEYARLLKESLVENVEFRVKLHDGSSRHLTSSCYKVGQKVVGRIKDITKVREHEDYITDYGARKDTLLDMVSHNLSGPLNLLQSLVSSLEKAVGENRLDDVRKNVRYIKENTNHCLEIVNEFLEEEHLVSEHVFVKKTRFDAIAKIKVTLERIQKSYPEKKIILTVADKAIFINSDEVKFFQIIHNLVSNSVKFTADDGRIEVIVVNETETITVKVVDNGIGIPEKYKGVVFNKYTPASRPGLKGEKSLGMGLYIVSRLVALLDGKIRYESTEQQGTTFYVTMSKGE
jgi:two-component system, OmpR family, sensor histidine kinase VicK